jgi:hypothetical protein
MCAGAIPSATEGPVPHGSLADGRRTGHQARRHASLGPTVPAIAELLLTDEQAVDSLKPACCPQGNRHDLHARLGDHQDARDVVISRSRTVASIAALQPRHGIPSPNHRDAIAAPCLRTLHLSQWRQNAAFSTCGPGCYVRSGHIRVSPMARARKAFPQFASPLFSPEPLFSVLLAVGTITFCFLNSGFSLLPSPRLLRHARRN